ncbi:12738_t:CDS:2 [Acaulospora colombiana]|uniref:12738_t:CDS:1 n=1 Tax=Acaulospora colombiana TaxID=27376 RepID=A0ACA9NN53_9GLOM|nr:12738_t:CDS:2 [Acaulospora colombiana]
MIIIELHWSELLSSHGSKAVARVTTFGRAIGLADETLVREKGTGSERQQAERG